MDQHVNGDSTDGMEGIQTKQRFTRTEAKDILSFADDHKCLCLCVMGWKEIIQRCDESSCKVILFHSISITADRKYKLTGKQDNHSYRFVLIIRIDFFDGSRNQFMRKVSLKCSWNG